MKINNELQMVICVGLPASGKSTYAKALEKDGWIRVEKDEIRKNGKLFTNGQYSHKRGDESIVLKERNKQIRQALEKGNNVVSSDTNLHPKHITALMAIAREYGAKVEQKNFLDVPLKELIERDQKRDDSVGEQVIRRMFHTFVKTMPTFLEYDPALPFVVVSDLDGTLCNMVDRSPYEWHKVGQDDINLGVAHMLDGVKTINYCKLFLFSGRDEVCRPETEEWLERHDIEYDALYMRRSDHKDEKGGQVPDTVVKAEMIEKYIAGKYNVLIWFDDRPQIANMLRDVYGINVAQMGDVNNYF